VWICDASAIGIPGHPYDFKKRVNFQFVEAVAICEEDIGLAWPSGEKPH
jgi:hypothetical protein